MSLKVAYLGAIWDGGVDEKNDLLLLIFKRVSGCEIQVVDSPSQADFLLAYPYVTGSAVFRFKWLVCMFMRRLQGGKYRSDLFRWLLGSREKPVLFISPENLDRPFWWNMIGKFLIESDVPRLTFWPNQIDPKGARFPYWYNYIDWSQYPRENFYERFGLLYSLDKLMTPLPQSSKRLDKAISISSHLEHPRQALMAHLNSHLPVDSWGGAGRQFGGGKLDLMRCYKYAFCPENSTGYGYDTEKLPEAWMAGCIPVGMYLNPFSEFNSALISKVEGEESEAAYKIPLLLEKPSLSAVENYVKFFIQKYIPGCTSL